MILYTQTVAAAVNFDGLAVATGLLDFTATYTFPALTDVCPVVYGVFVTMAAAAAGRIRVDIGRIGGAAEDREILIDTGVGSTETSVSYSPEPKRIIYRDGAVIYGVLISTTKGGAGNATCGVLWRPESIGSAGDS